MKVLALTITFVVFGLSALVSQEQSKPKIPTGKDFMFEIDFTPFTGEQIMKIEQFRGRYYFNEHWAVRLGVTFDFKKERSAIDGNEIEVNEDNQFEQAYEKKSNMIGFSPGFEYRILAQSKVSPYVGAEFIYQTRISEENNVTKEYDGWDNTILKQESNFDGAWEEWYYDGNYYVHDYVERAYNRFGGNVFTGVDFYFVRNFYFGFELGAGFQSTKYKDINIDHTTSIYSADGTVLQSDSDDAVIRGYNKFSTGFYVINAIRIGAWF
jgi:hypothetical protein